VLNGSLRSILCRCLGKGPFLPVEVARAGGQFPCQCPGRPGLDRVQRGPDDAWRDGVDPECRGT
jgi:hypothetical protein